MLFTTKIIKTRNSRTSRSNPNYSHKLTKNFANIQNKCFPCIDYCMEFTFLPVLSYDQKCIPLCDATQEWNIIHISMCVNDPFGHNASKE